MSTRPQFSRILHFVGMLAMSVTGTATIAQEARPPLQTKQQAKITFVGRDMGWTPLAFERFHGVIFFQGTINGVPATILLDNGFSHTTLDAGFARRIGLTIHETGQTARSGTAEVSLGMAEGVSIEVPHQLALTTATGVVDFSAISARIKHPIDAVLGGDLIGQIALSIYPSQKIMMLVPTGRITPRPGVHSREIPLISGDQIDAQVNGQPLRLQIDLGSDGVVSLSDTAWKRVFPDDGHATKETGTRFEGADLAVRRIAGNKLTFGGANVEGVPVESSGPLPGNQDGLLGQGILGTADIILDIPAKKLILMREAKPGEGSGSSSGENRK
ncbi:aspartyl protease family protein (plasmid) [Sphingobium limneticum]|jgi:Aspartyl protease|uniref:pepsin/retropepsin-like aspartic protease family protein n=1 Tax=Sphingobium sp. LB126 TaxID=1983755 RepID=UPI0018D51ADF|nr:pepsin/retropepsin-like aspartic protease family protein [Sphingobium sp. LB126]